MRTNYTPAGYWDRRYREGRTSGSGSEGDEGAYKAKYLSDFIAFWQVYSVIDWGCGDGQVLELVNLDGANYTGVDVSQTIVNRMAAKFPQYKFVGPNSAVHNWHEAYELSVSMDVLFHLPDDKDYFDYLDKLFGSSQHFVIIYATNEAVGRTARHVFRRRFTPDIAKRFPEWKLRAEEMPLREGLASFFVYEKVSG